MACVGKAAWFAWKAARRCLVYYVVIVGKPGRSLCKDVRLLFDLA